MNWWPHFKNFTLKKLLGYTFFFFALALLSEDSNAQDPTLQNMGRRFQNTMGGIRSATSGGQSDSLRHRDKFEDSITISFRYLDSTGTYKLDSSIKDFYRRFPLPLTYVDLGNTGTASRSILFSPKLQAGFDPGFHAFDAYTWDLSTIRFFTTTRPYSELNYFLGTRVEQIIELMHTQNIRPNWNFGFHYRLVNSPGFFQNQKSNHNNYEFNSRYQTKNLRYTAYLALVANKLQAGENGGFIDTTSILRDPIYKQRYNIPTYIGGSSAFTSNFFSTKLNTGNQYSKSHILYRHQYDLGKKDSIVTDSTVIPLFYPRIRFEHSFELRQEKYTYIDKAADSAYYAKRYDSSNSSGNSNFGFYERWQVMTNDFSIYQFPDKNNLQQFIKLGLTIQHISGDVSSGNKTFLNTMGHAEYRNKTRNQTWDIEALGHLFFTGFNSGDFDAHISLQRSLGKKLGSLQLGFENALRTPSFNFDGRSSFYLMSTTASLKKENNTHVFAYYFLPSFRMRLSGHYYLSTNYTYYRDYYKVNQETSLFNLLQISLQKTFRIKKNIYFHTETWFQQKIGNAPINVPVIFTRNRIAYEGNLGFKNLDIALGLEMKYRSPYRADGYSPALGQFYFQDSLLIRNATPDLAAYVHFRIRPFKAFIRAENLNTGENLQGFGFTRNNLLAPGYALPGLQIRFGIYWSFVN